MGQRPLWIHVDELRDALEAINYTPEEGDDSLHKWPKHKLFAVASKIQESEPDGRGAVIRDHFQVAAAAKRRQRAQKMSAEHAPPPVELRSNSDNPSAEEFFGNIIAGHLLLRGNNYEDDIQTCSRIMSVAMNKITDAYYGVQRDKK